MVVNHLDYIDVGDDPRKATRNLYGFHLLIREDIPADWSLELSVTTPHPWARYGPTLTSREDAAMMGSFAFRLSGQAIQGAADPAAWWSRRFDAQRIADLLRVEPARVREFLYQEVAEFAKGSVNENVKVEAIPQETEATRPPDKWPHHVIRFEGDLRKGRRLFFGLDGYEVETHLPSVLPDERTASAPLFYADDTALAFLNVPAFHPWEDCYTYLDHVMLQLALFSGSPSRQFTRICRASRS